MDLEVLRKAPLFTNLDDEVFAILTSELTEVELSRGASAFHEGDQGDQLYVIMSGKIKLGRTASDGRENLVAVLGPGEIVGELTLFDPGPRSTTATAVAPTELLTLDHNQLMTFVESHPQLAKDMLRALAQRLRDRHNVDIHITSQMDGTLHSFDRETGEFRLASRLSEGQRAVRMAAELGFLEAGDDIAHIKAIATFAGQHAGFVNVVDATVLAKEVADLASSHADVTGRHIDLVANVALQLSHEGLTETHDF